MTLYHTVLVWCDEDGFHVRATNNDTVDEYHAQGVGLDGDSVSLYLEPGDDPVRIDAVDKMIHVATVMFEDHSLAPEIHLEFVEREELEKQ